MRPGKTKLSARADPTVTARTAFDFDKTFFFTHYIKNYCPMSALLWFN